MVLTLGKLPRALVDRGARRYGFDLARGLEPVAVVGREVAERYDADRAMGLVEHGHGCDPELDDMTPREGNAVAVANVEELRVHDVRNDLRHGFLERQMSRESDEAGLPRRLGDGEPEIAARVDALFLREHEPQRHVRKHAMKATDHHVGLPSHRGMNGV